LSARGRSLGFGLRLCRSGHRGHLSRADRSALSWIPVDEEVSRTAGALARRYGRSHSGIDDADYLIAATALTLDAELLTTDVRHFPMLPGLRPPY
jgi:predicted nucleic acid-binding protein